MHTKLLPVFLSVALLVPACVTTTSYTRTWDGNPAGRPGRVEWIKETTHLVQGNPAAGAAAGAVIGGFLGGLLTGRRSGALAGAAGGAMMGAAGSQGRGAYRTYDMLVRFDDGAARVFRYRGYPPFRPGERVAYTRGGLVPGDAVAPPAANVAAQDPPQGAAEDDSPESAAQPPADAPKTPPPPPTQAPGTPPAQAQAQAATPDGQWVYTQQYGWLWMPQDDRYTFSPDYENGDPYMYVYYPRVGWTWVVAPWLWGWGPVPWFGPGIGVHYHWYGNGWGHQWRGHRPSHYRYHGGHRHHSSRSRRHR